MTRTQLLRALRVVLPALVVGKDQGRLLRRELGRLRDAGLVHVQMYPGTGEPVYVVTSVGEDLLLGLGRLTEARGDVWTPYQNRSAHSRLLRDVALTFYCARSMATLTPQITKLAWEEHPVFVVGDESADSVSSPDLGSESGLNSDNLDTEDGTQGVNGMDMNYTDGVYTVSLYPDAVAYLAVDGDPKVYGFAVEADLSGGERPHGAWGEKVVRYLSWWKNVTTQNIVLPAGVETDTFQVLVVTPSAIRARHLAEATAALLGKAGPPFRFTTPTLWTETTFWNLVWWPAGLGLAPEDGPVRLLEDRPALARRSS